MMQVKSQYFYGLYNPKTGRYWKGNLPTGYRMGGQGGRASSYLKRWKPNFADEPTTWKREDTALKKLQEYTMLSVVKENPSLVLRKFEIAPRPVSDAKLVPMNERTRQFSRLYYLYGSDVATDFDNLDVFDRSDIIYMARTSTAKDCLTATLARKHLTHSLATGRTVFMTEDDAVMLRMVAPRTKLVHLPTFFASEISFD